MPVDIARAVSERDAFQCRPGGGGVRHALKALASLGFERRPAKAALDVLRQRGEKPEVEPLLRAALALL